MSELDKIILVTEIAKEIETFNDERLQRLWLRLQDADDVTKRAFKAAAHAVRVRRLAIAQPLNRLAA